MYFNVSFFFVITDNKELHDSVLIMLDLNNAKLLQETVCEPNLG